METNEVGFYEEKKGHKSFTRLNIAWYFWAICFPGSLWLLGVLGTMILRSALTISDAGTLAGVFIVLQLGWIAPKHLSKLAELSDALTKLRK